MGGIWISGADLVGSLSELVGVKLGLVVGEVDLRAAVVSRGLGAAWPDHFDRVYRYRSEEVEELALAALAGLGDADADRVRSSPSIALAVLNDVGNVPNAPEALSLTVTCLGRAVREYSGDGPIDPRPIRDEVASRFGRGCVLVVDRFLEEVNARLYTSLWTSVRRRDFSTRTELRALFDEGDIPVELGAFFDQRFVDFLHANPDDLARMHWRQFERLVAEQLDRLGLRVELGPGSGDDGVDVRAWSAEAETDSPALLVVQCKRQARKIEKVVVKALAADVAFEGAQAGLLVTTSAWSPGARATVTSRCYPVSEANRVTLEQWLAGMRTPGAGAWLAS